MGGVDKQTFRHEKTPLSGGAPAKAARNVGGGAATDTADAAASRPKKGINIYGRQAKAARAPSKTRSRHKNTPYATIWTSAGTIVFVKSISIA